MCAEMSNNRGDDMNYEWQLWWKKIPYIYCMPCFVEVHLFA